MNPKRSNAPHERREPDALTPEDLAFHRQGKLNNGNPSGDLRTVPKCGAMAKRTGSPCQCPAMANGRCRLHGGLSTGPKTPEGRERARRGNLKHGFYSREAKAERRLMAEALRSFKRCLKELEKGD